MILDDGDNIFDDDVEEEATGGHEVDFPDFNAMKKKDLIEYIDGLVASSEVAPEDAEELKGLKVADMRVRLEALFGDPESLSHPAVTGVDPTDPIGKAVVEAQSVEDEVTATKLVHTLQDGSEYDAFRLGAILARMQTSDWTGEYDDFWTFCQSEFNLAPRSVRRYIQVYAAVTTCGATWTEASKIGWTKLGIVARVLDAESKDEVFTAVVDLSKRATEEWVKARLGGTEEEEENESSEVLGQYTVKYQDQDLWEVVSEAMEAMKQDQGIESNSHAFHRICLSHLSGVVPTAQNGLVNATPSFEQALDMLTTCIQEEQEQGRDVSDTVIDAIDSVLPGDLVHWEDGEPEEEESEYLSRLRREIESGTSNAALSEMIEERLDLL